MVWPLYATGSDIKGSDILDLHVFAIFRIWLWEGCAMYTEHAYLGNGLRNCSCPWCQSLASPSNRQPWRSANIGGSLVSHHQNIFTYEWLDPLNRCSIISLDSFNWAREDFRKEISKWLGEQAAADGLAMQSTPYSTYLKVRIGNSIIVFWFDSLSYFRYLSNRTGMTAARIWYTTLTDLCATELNCWPMPKCVLILFILWKYRWLPAGQVSDCWWASFFVETWSSQGATSPCGKIYSKL